MKRSPRLIYEISNIVVAFGLPPYKFKREKMLIS